MFGSTNGRLVVVVEALLVLLCGLSMMVNSQGHEYGVDVSFPMHHEKVSTNYDWLTHNLYDDVPTPKQYKDMVVQPLGDREKIYNHMIEGCVKFYGDKGYRCLEYERDRVAMSLRQPQSMQNYTKTGFAKIKTPEPLWSMLADFWAQNKANQSPERWPTGNTYTNHWDSPTRIVNIENTGLRGGGFSLKQRLWDAAKETIQEWTNQELTQCSLYGVRVYTEGSMLSTHVDRLPLVSSAIINVDSDVEEPWPLEVIGHDGRAHNVTMEPGDMVLYESHSILHGRPFPLKGKYVANLFVHFEPVGHTLRHTGQDNQSNDSNIKNKRGLGGHETTTGGLPPYVIPGSPEEANWRRDHPTRAAVASETGSTTNAHLFAQNGELKHLEDAVNQRKDIVHATDENGWTPLHEGVRGGHVDVVKYLYKQGANVNQRTHDGKGGNALYWSKKLHGAEHPISLFLLSVGGVEIEPEL